MAAEVKKLETNTSNMMVTADAEDLEAELGAAPVAALGVVADGVVSAHADPIRDGPVLSLLLHQLLLYHEGLVGWHLGCWKLKESSGGRMGWLQNSCR